MTDIDAAIAKLEELHAKRGQLHAELKRSLALQNLWPGAFDGDKNPTTQVSGNPRRQLTFAMYNGNERHEMPLEEVPVILWPDAVKADIRQLGGFHGSWKYYKLLREEDNAKKS